MAKGYLPDYGPGKHTLIMTRNPSARGIPARGLEVLLLDMEEVFDMLCTLSDIKKEVHLDEAKIVVEKLGFLPLAIDQTTSYVQAVTKGFVAYLDVYRNRRRELYNWVSDGNRQYSYSVASTWSMSFEFISKSHPPTAKLLQFFTLLNPDTIMLEFVKARKDALDNDAKEISSDSLSLFKSLITLEKFSIK